MAIEATTTTNLTTTATIRTGAEAPIATMATMGTSETTDRRQTAIDHLQATGTTTAGMKTTDPDPNNATTTMADQTHTTTRDLGTAQQEAEIQPRTGETTEASLATGATTATTMADL